MEMKQIMRQITTVKWWGKFKYLLQHITFYATIIILINTSIAAYTTGVDPWLRQHNIQIPYLAFLIGIIVILLLALIFEYKLTLPGFHSVWNEQWWRHDNPMRQELEAMRKELKAIKKELKIQEEEDDMS